MNFELRLRRNYDSNHQHYIEFQLFMKIYHKVSFEFSVLLGAINMTTYEGHSDFSDFLANLPFKLSNFEGLRKSYLHDGCFQAHKFPQFVAKSIFHRPYSVSHSPKVDKIANFTTEYTKSISLLRLFSK